jgi:hypothetical protein
LLQKGCKLYNQDFNAWCYVGSHITPTTLGGFKVRTQEIRSFSRSWMQEFFPPQKTDLREFNSGSASRHTKHLIHVHQKGVLWSCKPKFLVCTSMYTNKDGVHHSIPQWYWCTLYLTPKKVPN